MVYNSSKIEIKRVKEKLPHHPVIQLNKINTKGLKDVY